MIESKILHKLDPDKYCGCLLGGALGDSIGYPIEFFPAAHIKSPIFLWGSRPSRISDDTQMTLFTVAGLIDSKELNENEILESIYTAYQNWYLTQYSRKPIETETCKTLMSEPKLYVCRAPGITCLNSLKSGIMGTIESPINDSKGCGGVMRVAPIGLYFDPTTCGKIIEEIDLLGAKVAAMTHGHELGYIPAAAFVHIICRLAHTNYTIEGAVTEAIECTRNLFGDKEHFVEFEKIMQKAIDLSKTDITDRIAIKNIGEGWVEEETLAIAVYCALKYQNDFESAIIASVCHDGDSDSTGSVTGNILGAYLGARKLSQDWLKRLELKELINDTAIALCDKTI